MRNLACAIAFLLFIQHTLNGAPPRKIEVGEKPESVCRGFDDKLFVTIIDGEEPGDGGINVIEGDEVRVFCRGMNSPKGITYVGGFLVVADETTVWKVNADGKMTKLATLSDFPEPIEFLNDIVSTPDGKGVYVTEMSHPKWMFDPARERTLWPLDSPEAKCPNTGCVYQVGLDRTVTQIVPAGGVMTGPNGVAVGTIGNAERILLGDFFSGRILAWDGDRHTLITDGLRGADGVELVGDTIYVSSWSLGKVWKYDLKRKSLTLVSDNFTTAADLFFDQKTRQIIVPDMIDGTLTFLPLN